MEPRCTCGAYLPADARFCHKCGKPQFAEDIERERELAAVATPPIIAPAQPVVAAVPVRSRKYRAVVISLFFALLAMVLMTLLAAVSPGFVFIVLFAAGFFAAIVYGKQIRSTVSFAAGAGIGWLTGLWLFGITMISLAKPDIIDQLRKLPQARGELMQDYLQNNPNELIAILAFAAFCLFTFLPGLGGLLGASWARGRHRAS